MLCWVCDDKGQVCSGFWQWLFAYQSSVAALLAGVIAVITLIVPARQLIAQRRAELELRLEHDFAALLNALRMATSALNSVIRAGDAVREQDDPWTWDLREYDRRLARADELVAKAIDLAGSVPISYGIDAMNTLTEVNEYLTLAHDARAFITHIGDGERTRNPPNAETAFNRWRNNQERLTELRNKTNTTTTTALKSVENYAKRFGVRRFWR
jgi:hypothetical protein